MLIDWIRAGRPDYSKSWIDPDCIGDWFRANGGEYGGQQMLNDDGYSKITSEYCQPFFMKKGAKMICCKNVKKLGIINSEKFTFEDVEFWDICKTTSSMKLVPKFKLVSLDKKKEVIVNIFEFFNYFAVGYAMTVHKSQGQSIDEPFTIWETKNPRVNEKWLYTALTRATKFEYINIGK